MNTSRNWFIASTLRRICTWLLLTHVTHYDNILFIGYYNCVCLVLFSSLNKKYTLSHIYVETDLRYKYLYTSNTENEVYFENLLSIIRCFVDVIKMAQDMTNIFRICPGNMQYFFMTV